MTCPNCSGAGFLHVPYPHRCPSCDGVSLDTPLVPVDRSAVEEAERRAVYERLNATSDAHEIAALLRRRLVLLSSYRSAAIKRAWAQLVEAGLVVEPTHQLVRVGRRAPLFGGWNAPPALSVRAHTAEPAWQLNPGRWASSDGVEWDCEPRSSLSHGHQGHLDGNVPSSDDYWIGSRTRRPVGTVVVERGRRVNIVRDESVFPTKQRLEAGVFVKGWSSVQASWVVELLVTP